MLDELLPYEIEEGMMERDSISRDVDDDFDDLLDSVIQASSRYVCRLMIRIVSYRSLNA